MHIPILKIATQVLLFICCLQCSVLGEDGTEFMTHLKEMRSILPKESQVTFDKLWQDTVLHRQQLNSVELGKDFEEILLLIPNSIPTWKYAAWSLAYIWQNQDVAVEKEYQATRQAIILLMNGVKANPDNPLLLSALSWYIGQKIGFHKHKGSMRARFRHDKELHQLLQAHVDVDEAIGAGNAPDNWLTASLLSRQAIAAYSKDNASIGDKFPGTFCSGVALALSKHAESLADDGQFGNETVAAWQNAFASWGELADRPFDLEQYGVTIRMRDFSHLAEIINEGGDVEDSIKTQYRLVKTWRLIVNIDAWQQRCKIEQLELVLKARKALSKAIAQHKRDSKNGITSPSNSTRNLLDVSIRCWADVYENNRDIFDNGLIYEDVGEVVEIYRKIVLSGLSLPKDFPLSSVLRHWEKELELLKK